MLLSKGFSPRLLVVAALTAIIFPGLSEASPKRASAARCLVKVNRVAEANGSKPFKFRSLKAGKKAPVDIGVFDLYSAASIGEQTASTDASTMTSVCDQLKSEFPGVILAASPDFEVSVTAIPNDTNYSSLYGMTKISAPDAWDINTNAHDVVVGIIDTGIDLSHPDLSGNLWTNTGEIPANGIDDDGNGFIDDIHGYDFHNNDGDPTDDNGHGSHCAGTIGGKGNNGLGVAGVAWDVKMAGLKFLGSNGSGYLSNAIRAINYANMMGFPITNNSWGGGGFSQVMHDAIQAAGTSGMLFVAAAGNSGYNADYSPMYPAGYTLSNIISVAATDSADELAYFSNYGANSVDVAAPGVGIYSTYKYGQYATLSGTSMATPHVAGMAAVILGANPQFSALQIKDSILNNTDYKSNLVGMVATKGRVNLFKSLVYGPVGSGDGGDDSFSLNLFDRYDFNQSTISQIKPRDRLTLSLTNPSGLPLSVDFKASGRTCALGVFSGDHSWNFGVGDKVLKYFSKFRFVASDGGVTQDLQTNVTSYSAFVKGVSSDKDAAFAKVCGRLNGTVINY
jgi:subtilisin family serine protease